MKPIVTRMHPTLLINLVGYTLVAFHIQEELIPGTVYSQFHFEVMF